MLVKIDCLVCQASFEYDHASRGRRRRFCSHACRVARQKAQNLVARRAWKNPYVRAKPIAARCVICGTAFETVHRKTKTCGPSCANRYRKARTEATRHANAMAKRTRTCSQCSTNFIARNPSGAERRASHVQKYCSVACANAAKRAPSCEAAE